MVMYQQDTAKQAILPPNQHAENDIAF